MSFRVEDGLPESANCHYCRYFRQGLTSCIGECCLNPPQLIDGVKGMNPAHRIVHLRPEVRPNDYCSHWMSRKPPREKGDVQTVSKDFCRECRKRGESY